MVTTLGNCLAEESEMRLRHLFGSYHRCGTVGSFRGLYGLESRKEKSELVLDAAEGGCGQLVAADVVRVAGWLVLDGGVC